MTHGEDLDGLVSAALLVQSIEDVRVSFAAPSEALVSEREWGAVLDLPLPRGGAEVWVDHHPHRRRGTSRARLEVVDPNARSAAELLMRSEPDEHPGMGATVELTSRVDSGELGMEGARFAAAVKRIFRTRRTRLSRVVDEILRVRPAEEGDLVGLPTIKKELEIIRSEAGDLLSRVEKIRFRGEGDGTAILVDLRDAPGYLGVVALSTLTGAADLIGTIGPSSGEAYRVSLRSRGGSDVTALELARSFGGGGHRHAAGARLIGQRDLEALVARIREAGLRVEILRP